MVNLLAVWQLKALADHLSERGPADQAATLRYLEYQPVEGANLSLHSKVMLFDRDIFIGSSNADLRSLMMDSNNGVFIRNAPDLVAAYKARIDTLITTPGRLKDDTARIGRDKDQLSIEMNQLIDQLLARYAGPDRLSAEQQADLKQQVQDTTQKVYELSRRIMQGMGRRRMSSMGCSRGFDGERRPAPGRRIASECRARDNGNARCRRWRSRAGSGLPFLQRRAQPAAGGNCRVDV